MLTEVFNNLATNVGPVIFEAIGFEKVVIIRPVRAADEYGGQSETSTTESDEIPATIKYTNNRQNIASAVGQEYIDARIEMPLYHNGELVDVVESDRVKVLDRGQLPERVFQVKKVKPTPMHLILEVVSA